MSEQRAGMPDGLTKAPSRATIQAMLAALAIVAAHTLLVWGYPSLWWGDYGRWLHEVDRVAHGATFYRDIYWAFPPLAMWTVGGITRIIGSEVTQVWTVTAFIAAAISTVYGAVVARLVSGRTGVLVAATGMLLGAAYSQQQSAPLALGMYTPAAPVAILCLMAQLLAFLRDWERPGVASAVAVGALGGLGFLAKHDVWFASAWLALAAGVVTTPGRESRLARVLAAGGGYAAVAGLGVAALAAQHGVGALGAIFTGFGHVEEYAGMNLPTASMLVVDVASFGITVAVVAAVGVLSGTWRTRTAWVVGAAGLALAVLAMGAWLWKAELVERQMIAGGIPEMTTPFERRLLPLDATWFARARHSFGVLRLEMLSHAIPFALPVAVLAHVFAKRPAGDRQRGWHLVTVLLVACIALRARRMVAFTEWSSLMIEVPVYAAVVTLLWPAVRSPRIYALPLACLALVAVGLRAQWQYGYGVLSRRGVFPTVATARGQVRIHPGLAADLAYVRDLTDAADPSGTRPILAFGYSGGPSYFTGRPSVDPLTHGFRLSLFSTADSAYRVAAAQKERLFLVDNVAYGDAIVAPRFAPWRWMPEMMPNAYQRIDRPLFERLMTGCRTLTMPDRHSAIFTVYDCAPRPHGAPPPAHGAAS